MPVPRSTFTLQDGFMGDVNEAVAHIRRALDQSVYTGPAPARTVLPIPQPERIIGRVDTYSADAPVMTLTTAQSAAWHCGHGRPGGYLCPHCMALA